MLAPGKKVVALCGGVGGAKLALGLDRLLASPALSIVVNVGDDFEHLGLHISPDIDTVLYTLGDLGDTVRGWGRAEETWHCLDSLRMLGEESWFQLGDRDLALHIARTRHLRGGGLLDAFVARAAAAYGINARILPATNDSLATIVETPDGDLPFQRYFVEQRCAPVVQGLRFVGADAAQAAPGVRDVLADPDLAAILICPSNPYLSVDPILAVSEIRAALHAARAPVICISPIIAGQAIKGPTVKIMHERGILPNQRAIRDHYGALIDALVVDTADAKEASTLDLPVLAVPTLMTTIDDKTRLAKAILTFATAL